LAHQRVVERHVLSAPPAEQPRWAARATDFLRELLSPFEMTFRGYRDANRELLRLNEQLAQQKEAVEVVNRELQSFSYSVSHDLRAPLRAIDRFSQALVEDHAGQLDQDALKYLRRVRQAVGEMGQLIEGLLMLSRVTRADLSPTSVDVSALVRRIASRFQAADPTRQVDFVIQEGLTEVGDEPLLVVLLENLLGNAWKFTSKRPQARIEFGRTERDQKGQAEYFVRDNGAGFDMAYADKLFGAFQRLHSTSEFEGTGIGLATVERVVRRHGGTIRAEGAVDRGATFYFTLGAGTRGP